MQDIKNKYNKYVLNKESSADQTITLTNIFLAKVIKFYIFLIFSSNDDYLADSISPQFHVMQCVSKKRRKQYDNK